MSRPYRIVVQKALQSEVTVGDRSTLRITLDPILPEEQLEELLARVLERDGWEPAGADRWRKQTGEGEVTTVDIAAREVITEVEARRQVTEQVRRELRGDTWNWRQMREMTAQELDERRRQAAEELGGEVSEERRRQVEQELAAEVRRQLESGAAERRRLANRIVIEVMSEALKERARELGTVRHIDERWDGEEYELTIAISE